MTEVTFTAPITGSEAPAPVPASDRPEWLPDNFKTPEDMAASYKELQTKFTQTTQELSTLKGGKPAETTPPVEPKPGEEAPKSETEAAQEVADKAGFDMTSYSAEFEKTGDVTPENRQKIAEGLKAVLGEGAQEIVDQFIEGRKATLANDQSLYHTEAGGEQAYSEMIQWAAKNLPRAEIDAYNASLATGNRHATMLAIRGLRATYESQNGRAPRLQVGGGQPRESGYTSSAEMQRDMANPLYRTDAAFRETVKRRLALSK